MTSVSRHSEGQRANSDVCRRSIQQHSKSFALASRLLPASSRDAVFALYAWCRRADDAIDLCPEQAQPAALSTLHSELDGIYEGLAQTDPVLYEFQAIVQRYSIPQVYPRALLHGMGMDVERTQYESFDDLLLYCYRVASTVGLMLCHVFGVRSERALRFAAHLGIAMQLTNIARDVSEDWARGRLYLPAAFLRSSGVSQPQVDEHAFLPESNRRALSGAVAELLDVADEYYASAERGFAYLPLRVAIAVSGARHIYAAIGSVLRRRGCDVAAPRAVVSTSRKVLLCAWGAFRACFIKAKQALSPGSREVPRGQLASPVNSVEPVPKTLGVLQHDRLVVRL